jgi:hypothetical protein
MQNQMDRWRAALEDGLALKYRHFGGHMVVEWFPDLNRGTFCCYLFPFSRHPWIVDQVVSLQAVLERLEVEAQGVRVVVIKPRGGA